MRVWFAFCVAWVSVVSAVAFADAPLDCKTSQPVDKYRFLRKLSLDLLGRIPAYEEYVALDGQTDVTDAAIDAMLKTDEFRVVARRWHESWLWPNLSGVRFGDVAINLQKDKATGISFSSSAGRRKIWRKGTGAEICGDWQQTQFVGDAPVPIPIVDAAGKTLYQQDGWVMVAPYWKPDTPIKVCAFEAQVATTGKKYACNVREGISEAACGCGPNLRWCWGTGVETAVAADLREQFLRAVDDATTGLIPYSHLLTTQRVWQSAKLLFWRKNLANLSSFSRVWTLAGIGDPPLPTDSEASWTDPTWTQSLRTGSHSGILTLPGYSLRFQTNRGRANRFRMAFEGQSFVPPATTVDTKGCVPGAADLTQACVCRHCHQVLEPLAAYFAPVVEAGTQLNTDKSLPPYDAKCDPSKQNKVSPFCQRFYVVDAKAHRPGWLLTHQWAEPTDALHAKIIENIASGPRGLAQASLDSGQFHVTTVRNLWLILMHREMLLDPTRADDELPLLATLAAEFKKSDDYRTLVRRLVHLPQYRRLR
ncbi:MAG: hypothetical protein EXR77_18970 [Myxococcales bacterium]|nr:hypothetical protein [Myxococcales bacterium]